MSYIHHHGVVHDNQLVLFHANQTTGDFGTQDIALHMNPVPLCVRGAVSPAGVKWIVVVNHDGWAEVTNLETRKQYRGFPRTFGAGSVALRMVGEFPELYAMKAGNGSAVFVYNMSGEELRQYHRSPSSQQPLWKIQADGTPWLSNDPERRWVRVESDGIAFYNWDQDGDFLCGGGDGWAGTHNASCLMVRKLSSGETRCLWFESAHLPWIVEVGGTGVLIPSGNNAPPGVRWEDLSTWEKVRTVPVEPAPEPSPELPAVPVGLTIWAGYDNSPGFRASGNCTWSGTRGVTPDSRPAVEMSQYAPEWIPGRTVLCGLWLTDGNIDPKNVEVEIAFAKAKDAKAVHIQWDDAGHTNVPGAAALVTQAGLLPIVGVHVRDDAQMLKGQLAKLTGDWGAHVNCQVEGRTKENIAASLRVFVEHVNAHKDTLRTVFFTRQQVGKWPELDVWIEQFLAGVQTPALRPGFVPVKSTEATPRVGERKPLSSRLSVLKKIINLISKLW
jgi:hypothetical protein